MEGTDKDIWGIQIRRVVCKVVEWIGQKIGRGIMWTIVHEGALRWRLGALAKGGGIVGERAAAASQATTLPVVWMSASWPGAGAGAARSLASGVGVAGVVGVVGVVVPVVGGVVALKASSPPS